jgi:murein L,D-transpeptidase YcbB/YkuD
MKRLLLATFAVVLGFMGCQQSKLRREAKRVKQRDKTITPQNAYINRFMDSTTVVRFIDSAQLSDDDSINITSFYNSRNYQFAWFDSVGMMEQTRSFYNLYHQSADGSLPAIPNPTLDSLLAPVLDDSSWLGKNQSAVLPLELALTAHFFKFSTLAYAGDTTINLNDLDWFIPRKKIDPASFLDSIVANRGKRVEDYQPMHPMVNQLQVFMKKYADIEKKGGWQPIPLSKTGYALGDSSEAIRLLNRRLMLVDDLAIVDTGARFTTATENAVKQFQHRYGLKQDGKVSAALLQEMNSPVSERIRQMAINMERARWIPRMGNRNYIFVNIPSFTFYAINEGKTQLSMNIVVGTAAHSTVIFTGSLTTIAFSPYWNVPYSIVKNEMGRSASYFAKRNMEVVGHYSDGLPMVRQKPGGANALGKVKFLFPNAYSIYFHDTPSKSLFNESRRAFSHGCIRLAEPAKLAAYLLKGDPRWTEDSIARAMNGTKELQVKVAPAVPVFIGYFTAWVDETGKLNFRQDIYGHDKNMAKRMFKS